MYVRNGMCVIRSKFPTIPNMLKGTFTDEVEAKKQIVKYVISKMPKPPKRPKFKYKTKGRPTLFKRTSKWQKQNK